MRGNVSVDVSVVVPAFRARNYLECALRSVLAQSFSVREIIIVDDASPEPIGDIVDRVSNDCGLVDIRVLRHEHNKGLGETRNTGIKNAKGEFIAFLDHDDYWETGHIENVWREMMEADSDVAFSTALLFDSGREGEVIGRSGPRCDFCEIVNLGFALFLDSFIAPSSVLIKKSILHQVGLFSVDPMVHMCEDLDLWIRLSLSGARFAHAAEATAWYRKHPEAATRKLAYMARQAVYVREIYFDCVGGPVNEKREFLLLCCWRAASQLALARERDWLHYLRKAIAMNCVSPRSLPRNLAKWLFIACGLKRFQ